MIRDRSFDVATGYDLDVLISIPFKGNVFISLIHRNQMGTGAHQASSIMDTECSFAQRKADKV
jgi:hypothetical protein